MTAESASPVGDVDMVDVVGVRKDGGLDLAICAVAPLDASPATLSLLETKVNNYIQAALSEAFLQFYGRPPGTRVAIYISCAYPVAEAARALIEKLRRAAADYDIWLELRPDLQLH